MHNSCVHDVLFSSGVYLQMPASVGKRDLAG
jgi:hypothetical protein